MSSKILTVDDSKTIRMIVAKAFKPFDCQILEAANGVEGLAVAAREKPDLIILDFTMPVMDGGEMLGKLKADPLLKSVPVVMLTAEAGRETVMKIAKLGVRDYMIKPFKEEVVIEKVSRIIDLRSRGEGSAKVKRFDDPLNILVVDDKPAILEQIRAGLTGTPWTVEGRAQAGQVIDYCNQNVPDVILISLSLPENGGFTIFQMLRTNVRTKSVPIFSMSVKTAVDEQARAQQSGFTAIITKPIDFEDLKMRISRTLNLDTSYKYFETGDGVIILKLPENFSQGVMNEVNLYLRAKVSEAVDSGIDKMIINMSPIKSADVNLIKLGWTALKLCQELSLKHSIIGSESVRKECKQFEETKDWRFVSSPEEAMAAMGGGAVAV